MITILDRRGKIYQGTLIASKNPKKTGSRDTVQIRTIGGSIHVGKIIDHIDRKRKGVKRS